MSLINAAAGGKTAEVERLLAEGKVNINATDSVSE